MCDFVKTRAELYYSWDENLQQDRVCRRDNPLRHWENVQAAVLGGNMGDPTRLPNLRPAVRF